MFERHEEFFEIEEKIIEYIVSLTINENILNWFNSLMQRWERYDGIVIETLLPPPSVNRLNIWWLAFDIGNQDY